MINVREPLLSHSHTHTLTWQKLETDIFLRSSPQSTQNAQYRIKGIWNASAPIPFHVSHSSRDLIFSVFFSQFSIINCDHKMDLGLGAQHIHTHSNVKKQLET